MIGLWNYKLKFYMKFVYILFYFFNWNRRYDRNNLKENRFILVYNSRDVNRDWFYSSGNGVIKRDVSFNIL